MAEASKERNRVMEQYLDSGLFKTVKDSFIYVERTASDGIVRRGLVGLIDLDEYEYVKGNNALVRASENTVVSRLPPRIEVRRNAALELPHAMMLIDDPDETVIEPLSKVTNELNVMYDFELMEGGGWLRGWQVTGDRAEQVMRALDKLAERDIEIVIGDGNHSLAAAKECWNLIKETLTEEERANHRQSTPLRSSTTSTTPATVQGDTPHGDGRGYEEIPRRHEKGAGREKGLLARILQHNRLRRHHGALPEPRRHDRHTAGFSGELHREKRR
jgi:uncharacterized protein (DUF1015 family)